MINRIHIAIIAAWVGLVILMITTPTNAKDFSVAGQTLSVGASSDLNYTTGVEDWVWELTPSAGLGMGTYTVCRNNCTGYRFKRSHRH